MGLLVSGLIAAKYLAQLLSKQEMTGNSVHNLNQQARQSR
jgi:hypothetical protein